MIVAVAQYTFSLLTNPQYWRRGLDLFCSPFVRILSAINAATELRETEPAPPAPPSEIDLYKFRPMPVRADQQREVLMFRDRLDELRSLPYPPGYVVSSRWVKFANRFVEFCGLKNDARTIAYFGMSDAGFDVGLPKANVAWLPGSRARYIERHPELTTVGESPLVPSDRVVECDGVAFSHSLEQAFSYYSALTDAIGDEAMDVVVEIGGGYGRFVRLLKLSGRSRRFILVDLPESLLFAFAFLRLHFPEARMRVLRSAADCAHDISGDYDFTFCPVQLLHHLRPAKIDLVVDSYSLGEMQQGCVDHIMMQIDAHLRPRFFYSFNAMFINKDIHYAAGGNIGEGSVAVLNLQPQWWPVSFKLWNDAIDNGAWRSTVNTVLRRVAMPVEKLTGRLMVAADASSSLSDERLGYLYFAALGARDPAVREQLFSELRERHMADGFQSGRGYDFDAIGEVRFLRERAEAPSRHR